MKINTLRKVLCTLLVAGTIMLGMSIPTQAQGGPPPWAPAYGRRNKTPYGQIVSERRHRRNASRHEMMVRERLDRRDLNDRLRYEREQYGNSPTWRDQRKQEREDLRSQQREERGQFRQTWKAKGRH